MAAKKRRIVRLGPRDLRALARLVRGAWPTDAQLACGIPLVREKLFEGRPAVTVVGARSGAVLDGFVAVASLGRILYVVLGAVDPKRRGRGVATALLDWCEDEARRRRCERIRTLARPGNYLTPGIDVRARGLIRWLHARGWRERARNRNLYADLPPRQGVHSCATGYRIRRARSGERVRVRRWVHREFSVGWAREVDQALVRRAVHVALDVRGRIVAFAAHSGNNRSVGSFGPAGTLASHRGRGLGSVLVHACLADLARAGFRRALIPWVPPGGERFYGRVARTRVEGRYVVLERSVTTRSRTRASDQRR